MTTWQLEATALTLLGAFVAVLVVRTVLAERAAGTGGRDDVAWSRPRMVRRLDLAACVLSALCVTVLVTTVLAAIPG